jgi:hypothetical protein
MEPVELDVAQVIEQISRARGGAIRGERGQRLQPFPGVAGPGREDDPGEHERVLRPLPRPQSRERGTRLAARERQLESLCDGHGGGC